MQNISDLGRELEKRGKADDIKRLAQSPDGEKLKNLIGEAEIEKAVSSGDAAALKKILGSVLSTEEGRRLAENVRRMMEK